MVRYPGIDNKRRQTSGSSTSYFLADHLGSTNGLADSTGNLTASNSYDSFGNSANASFPTRYQFTGRELDGFSGLQHNRARFYDPNLGRFISEDPIRFGGGDINLYGYVWNNPQNYFDPLGLDGWGNDTADWLDSNINYARGFYKADPQYWGYNGTVDTVGDFSSMAVDPLRVGGGLGYALYDGNASGWQRAGAVGTDALRAAAIAGPLAGLGSKLAGLLERFGAPAAGIEACPLKPIHGNSLDSPKPTWGYELYENEGTFLKNGITSEAVPEARYTKGYMSDKYMKHDPNPFPNRRAAHNWERNQNMKNPGPLNKERYIKR